MAKQTGKKKLTAQEALILLCSEDYSCSNLTSSDSSNSDDKKNVDKISQNSSLSSDENNEIIVPCPKKLKLQMGKTLNMIIAKYMMLVLQYQHLINPYLPAVQNPISVQPDTTTRECGMCNHDGIQPQTNFTGIPSPEHVISIPLDIEENDTLQTTNVTQNGHEYTFVTPNIFK